MNKNKFLVCAGIPGLLLLLVVLPGCVSIKSVPGDGSAETLWYLRQEKLSQLQGWQIKGRIGFVSAKDSGSAGLYWEQGHESFELKVVAPLGAGRLVVVGDANGVVLQSSEGEILYAEDARSLIWQSTGWEIPVDRLRQWVIGLPTDAETYLLDDKGRVLYIENSHWKVEYLQYQDVGEYELPRKLQIESPEINIKLVIKDWQLVPEE